MGQVQRNELFVVVLAILFLSSCTQTLVQYQCQSGTFVERPDACPPVDRSQASICPELDCGACPQKIEYQEKIVEKPVVETKIKTVEKIVFLCADGIKVVENKEDCSYTLGDSIVAGNFKWKFTEYMTLERIGAETIFGFLGDVADGIFLIVNVEVENIGKTSEYLRTNNIKLVDGQGREYSTDSAAYYLEPDGSELPSFEEINPGINKKGKIVFDVPRNLKVADIRIASSTCDTNDAMFNVRLFR